MGFIYWIGVWILNGGFLLVVKGGLGFGVFKEGIGGLGLIKGLILFN